MKYLAALITLGLVMSITSSVKAEAWAEFTYEEAYGWTLDLPGPGCDCLSYLVEGDPPAEDDPRIYDGYVVFDYDEDAGTITLSHEDEGKLVFDFPWLTEWLDLQDEVDDPRFTWVPQQSAEEEQTCEGGSCECDGKCSACCPKGYLPDCNCTGSGKCKCINDNPPADGGP